VASEIYILVKGAQNVENFGQLSVFSVVWRFLVINLVLSCHKGQCCHFTHGVVLPWRTALPHNAL